MLANKKCYNAFYQTDKFRDCLKTNCGELPDDVLKKVYYKNALHLLPLVDKSPFPL
jgi:hypothetical protein